MPLPKLFLLFNGFHDSGVLATYGFFHRNELAILGIAPNLDSSFSLSHASSPVVNDFEIAAETVSMVDGFCTPASTRAML